MLTNLTVYSPWASVSPLALSLGIRLPSIPPDPFEIRNIDGLGPVNAAINTTSLSGTRLAYMGSTITPRNIVLTIHPNPDWVNSTYDSLRQQMYSYFTTQQRVRLVFDGDEISPVEIYGYVESCDPNIFSKEPEYIVSIICPDPMFSAVTPTVLTGDTSTNAHIDFDYDGTVETGIKVKITKVSGTDPTTGHIDCGPDPGYSTFSIDKPGTAGSIVDSTHYLEMSSVPGSKYLNFVLISNGSITNVLSWRLASSVWPTLKPGMNRFEVTTDQPGAQSYELTYYEKLGGI